MEPGEVLRELVALAGELGLDVRAVRGAVVEDGAPPRSAVCRVYGSLYVVLAAGDPVEARIAVLGEALRRHAPERLDERFLPPAVRAAIESGG